MSSALGLVSRTKVWWYRLPSKAGSAFAVSREPPAARRHQRCNFLATQMVDPLGPGVPSQSLTFAPIGAGFGHVTAAEPIAVAGATGRGWLAVVLSEGEPGGTPRRPPCWCGGEGEAGEAVALCFFPGPSCLCDFVIHDERFCDS